MELSSEQIEAAREHLAKAGTAYLVLAKAILANDLDAIKAANVTMAEHIGGAMFALNKDDAYTEGEHGQQLVGYNPDGKPKQNGAGKKTKTRSQVAYLLSDGSPLTDAQKKKLKEELHSGEVTVVPDKKEAALKGRLDRDGDRIRLFVPFTKITEFKTANGESLIISGIASVADYLDDQNDIPDAEALETAMREWAPFGNIRQQHKVDKPVGTIREPIVGEWADGNPRPGWRMITHPVTGTRAAEITAHIVDPETIKLVKAGVMTGFSIGGNITESRDVYADVDDSGVVRTILSDA